MPSQGIIRCPVVAVWNGRPGAAPCVSSMPSQGIIRCPVEAVWNGRPGAAPCVSSKYNNCREKNILPDSCVITPYENTPAGRQTACAEVSGGYG